MATVSPWAVLLCKFNDNDVEPYGLPRYLDLFTSTGIGKSGMVDYFADVSHGLIDISGSQVFGWLTLAKKRSDYLGLGSRGDIINWGKQAAAAAGIVLAPFYNVVVVMNVPTDLFGSRAGVCCDDGRLDGNGMSGLSPSFLGQEMLHGYDLDHARSEGSTVDYTDPFDIMSTASAMMTPHPVFTDLDQRANPVFRMGPALNASSMDSLGWLDRTRVWSKSDRALQEVIRLRPLHRRDLPGFLAAKFDQHYIEFRDNSGWDAAFPEPVVLVHNFFLGHSYIETGNQGTRGLRAGESLGTEPASASPPVVRVAPVMRVEVLTIDVQGKFADIRLTRQPGLEVPTIEVATAFGGIAQGGEGIVVLPGGGVRRVPPNSPLAGILEQVAVFEGVSAKSSLGLQQLVRREALGQIVATATRELAGMTDIREPTTSLENVPTRSPVTG